MKFIMTKKGFASVFPTVVSEQEIINYVEMTKGEYISASDMKEIEELYNTWPSYELKATVTSQLKFADGHFNRFRKKQ